MSLFKTSSSFIGYRIFRSDRSLLSRTALISVLVCVSFFVLTPNAYPVQVMLVWDPVIHPDLAGYKIYWGNSSRNYNVSTDVGNQTSCTIRDLIDNETYYFAATAYSIYGEESDFSNEVSYSSVNNSPVLHPIGTKSIVEGQLLQFTVMATDPDGDTLTYSVSNLPTGANFDSISHIFSWTPSYGDAGNYSVIFTVTDIGTPSLSDSETVTITVGDVVAIQAAPNNLTIIK